MKYIVLTTALRNWKSYVAIHSKRIKSRYLLYRPMCVALQEENIRMKVKLESLQEK